MSKSVIAECQRTSESSTLRSELLGLLLDYTAALTDDTYADPAAALPDLTRDLANLTAVQASPRFIVGQRVHFKSIKACDAFIKAHPDAKFIRLRSAS